MLPDADRTGLCRVPGDCEGHARLGQATPCDPTVQRSEVVVVQSRGEEYSRVRDDVMADVGRQIRQLAAEGLSVVEIEGRLTPGLNHAELELARLTARHVYGMGRRINGSA
jgi:hypothetical protein